MCKKTVRDGKILIFSEKKKLRQGIVYFFMFFVSSVAFSAPKINPVKSFKAIVPDTVVQGGQFTVVYALESTNWKDIDLTKGYGLTLHDLKYEKQDGKIYSQLLVKVKYSTSRVGRITLPPLTAEISGRKEQSEPKEVFVKPHPQYGEEMTLAHEWLIKKGASSDSLSFDYSAWIGNFFFFSDLRHKCFCLVAKKDTWNYAGNPIWAYSQECAMNEESLMEFVPYFFNNYSELLSVLKKEGKEEQGIEDEEMKSVPPLLGELRWGQNAPYNTKLPVKGEKHVLVGCVPLSMSMIMKYHEWPKQGKSSLYFETEGKTFNFDCKELTPQWEQYKSSYYEKEVEECAELSKVLGTLSLMMSPKYEDSGTAASSGHVKHVMCNNMGYSGRLSQYLAPSNTEAKKLLSRDISNRRPCLVSLNTHAFICDGQEDGFFHFNLGWKGQGNGYYRIPKRMAEKDSTFFKSIIVGIEPQKSVLKKEVTLDKPGTLVELLSDEEKENLTSLTISGPINSSDIRLIRAMAGAKGDSLYDSRNMGTLNVLDLTNATITKDKMPYRTRKATGTFSGYRSYTYSDGTAMVSYTNSWDYTFDFNNMDQDEWNQFLSFFANKQKERGLVYTRISNTCYFEHSFCIKNTIGSEMFSGCSSLCEIKLPKKTKAIFDYAFLDCSSLQKIQIPASTSSFGKDMFQNCLSLEKVYVPRSYWSYNEKGSFGSNLSPGFKTETNNPKK